MRKTTIENQSSREQWVQGTKLVKQKLKEQQKEFPRP